MRLKFSQTRRVLFEKHNLKTRTEMLFLAFLEVCEAKEYVYMSIYNEEQEHSIRYTKMDDTKRYHEHNSLLKFNNNNLNYIGYGHILFEINKDDKAFYIDNIIYFAFMDIVLAHEEKNNGFDCFMTLMLDKHLGLKGYEIYVS